MMFSLLSISIYDLENGIKYHTLLPNRPTVSIFLVKIPTSLPAVECSRSSRVGGITLHKNQTTLYTSNQQHIQERILNYLLGRLRMDHPLIHNVLSCCPSDRNIVYSCTLRMNPGSVVPWLCVLPTAGPAYILVKGNGRKTIFLVHSIYKQKPAVHN